VRVILDTNVFMSGVFFGGIPGRILGAFVEVPALAEPVSADPDDDKFLACAVAARVTVIVSGDKDLVDRSGWHGVRVLRPRPFVNEFLVEP